MTTTNLTQDQLISNIARELVSQVAPYELPRFRTTSEEYFKNPPGVLKGLKYKDEKLGFGLDTAIVYLTPIVLAITSEVFAFIVETVKESLREPSAEKIKEVVAKIFKKSSRTDEKTENVSVLPPEQLPEETEKRSILSREQLTRVHTLILEKARHFKVPDDQARLLADCLVGSLTIT